MVAPKYWGLLWAVPWFGRFRRAISATVVGGWCVDVGPAAEKWVPDPFSEHPTGFWFVQLPMSSHGGDVVMG